MVHRCIRSSTRGGCHEVGILRDPQTLVEVGEIRGASAYLIHLLIEINLHLWVTPKFTHLPILLVLLSGIFSVAAAQTSGYLIVSQMRATPRRSGRFHSSITVSGNGVQIDDQGSNEGVREMRIAVVDGTGLVGCHTVEALEREGHEVVVVARSRGVDVTTGAGLDGALAGVESVVDVTSTTATDPAAAREFFSTTTEHLLAAEQRAGVGHHVVLSIVGVDRVEGNSSLCRQAAPGRTRPGRPCTHDRLASHPVSRVRREGRGLDPTGRRRDCAAAAGAAGSGVRRRAGTRGDSDRPRHRVVHPILPDPKPRTWSIWLVARWRREANWSGWFRAGGTVPSASRWRGRSSCRDRARGSRRRPSMPGSRRDEVRGMAKPLAAEKTHRKGVRVPLQLVKRRTRRRWPNPSSGAHDRDPGQLHADPRGST